MNTLSAIETRYNGIVFRSRMEARWAVFMDELNIPYQYEPEAFRIGKVNYLPDFFLPHMDSFLEIKNPVMAENGREKAKELAMASKKKVFLICSPPRVPSFGDECAEVFERIGDECGGDHPYFWCECPRCFRCELQFDGRADRIDCRCQKSKHGDKGYNFDSPRLIRAHQKASGFRFGGSDFSLPVNT